MGSPPDAAEWHPPEEELEGDPTTQATEEKPSPQRQETPEDDQETTEARPETAVELFQPTPENPIEEVRIGLWQTLGQVDHPTRVVMRLKNGETGDIPWEKAEALLPPEYRTARELGQRARVLQRQASNLATAIRGGTDVMQRQGHIKDALLRPLDKTRPALANLYLVDDLVGEIADIGQESFLELRRMTNARQSRQGEIQELADRLNDCEQRLEAARSKTFRELPSVQATFDRYYPPTPEDQKQVGGGNRPELADPEAKTESRGEKAPTGEATNDREPTVE